MAAKELAMKLMRSTRSGDNYKKEMAKTLTDYLIKHIQVPIIYTGIIPGVPPTPDPIVTDILSVTGNIPELDNTDFISWVSSIEDGIMQLEIKTPGISGIKPITPVLLFKKGLMLDQNTIKEIHINSLKSTELYKWSKISSSDVSGEIVELEDTSDLRTDRFISFFAKIKDSSGNYTYYESLYVPCINIWEKICEKIIEWIENPVLHIISFPSQGTSSGSTGTANTLPIKVT